MRVLVVEDHEDTRHVLERYLTRCGYDVAAAADLRSGLTFLRSQPFDAIVSDIALPDGTGYALVSEARRSGINALAIAVSAYSYPRDVAETKLTGFDYHLRKPLDPMKLRSLLQHEVDGDDMPEARSSGDPSDSAKSYRRFDF